jgi:hypothetical protein
MARYIHEICNERYKLFLNNEDIESIIITKTYEILLDLIGNKNDAEFSLFFNINIINFKYIIDDTNIITFENIDDFLYKIYKIDDNDFYKKINIFLSIIKSTNTVTEKYDSKKRFRYN